MSKAIDLVQARRNAQRGVDRVEMGADAAWKERAYAVVERVARSQELFHPDDVWTALGDDVPREARALGAVMRRIAKDQVAMPTDWAQRSKLANCNQHWRPIWRSLIFSPKQEG